MTIFADILNAIPWLVLLVVFLGMLWHCHEIAAALDRALARGQEALPSLRPVQVPAPAAPVPLPPAAAKPVAVQPPAKTAAPPWLSWAINEIGFHETGNNQGIERYISLAHCGALGDPWCAIFANAALESSGVTGSRSASSQSFRTNPNFTQLSGPALGAIVVFWRGSQASGLGHVGFYAGEDANRVWTVGGNENDMVQKDALPKSSATFGLIGYFWPMSVPLPAIAPVLMPGGTPTSIQTAAGAALPATATVPNGKQTGITATYFGGQQSAYGGPIVDDRPGVALPFRFTGDRPQVRVTNPKTGASVVCAIVDVGPWNINDPYWQTGTRPQAESGNDLGQVSKGVPRHTNKAGIDLTLAAATTLGIDGKGLVEWEFVESPSPAPATPNVV